MKILAGDNVKIMAGKDRGKVGKVEKSLPSEGKLIVAGVNIVHKHVKPARGREGGIVEKTLPIAVSSVMLVCPHCEKAARVGYQMNQGKKERICKKCGVAISL